MKVLTALVAIRRLDPQTVVIGTPADAQAQGSQVGIAPGGLYTVRQLLLGLLLNSGNDAANALAGQLGGVDATVAEMADTARRLGALDTRPASTSGLDGPGMSASAYDMALLFREAMRLPLFAETIATRLADWPGPGAGQPGYKISNDNKLLANYPGALGGKTGFTDDARHTFIGAAARGGRRLVVVLLRAEQPTWVQAGQLLDYGFALPAGTEPVGTLVDAAPAEPKPAVAAPSAAEFADGASEIVVPLLVAGGAAGGTALGALFSVLWWNVRRRPAPGRAAPPA
jgi:D-alanyl-D-alanine carboxypeptidase (penicillin-binding protein 5/6)